MSGGGAASDKRRWTPRLVDDPRVGTFACTLVRGGYEVGAEVHHSLLQLLWRPGPELRWWCEINGVSYRAEATENPFNNDKVMRVLNYGREIDAEEYCELLNTRRGVDPFKPIDRKTLPVPF